MDGSGFQRPPLRRTPGEQSSSGRSAHPRSATGRPRPERRRPAPRPEAARPRKPKVPKKGSPRRVGLIALLAVVLALVALSAVGCTVFSSISKDLPDPGKQLQGRDQTSRVLDRDGRKIADLFAEQNRTVVKFEDIPETLRNAVIATEDERYYQHKGVDPLGILRALYTDLKAGTKAQGGSTITQQYVKKALLTDERTWQRKVSEAILAYQVEKRFTKDEILAMYLNTIYFGHGAYGVQRAAEVYFGKPLDKLDTAECAMLAGVIKSPWRYSPRNDEETARSRRHIVLKQMRDQNYIDSAEFAKADAAPFKLAAPQKSSVTAPYFVEYVKNTLVEKFGADAVYRGGLTIRTTLDSKMQRAAEKAVRETLDRKGDPSAALVAIDPKTGEVRAMVGGADFARQQYNVAVQGRRQPGSAFKPFVLVAGLKNGVSPEQPFESGPVELTPKGASTPWKVTGAGKDRTGPMRLREATELSVNSVYAQLILQIGADKVTETAEALGITTPIEDLPAIALGGLEKGVSPLEMASAYATLADAGTQRTPHGIVEVTNPAGEVLLGQPTKTRRAITPAVAYLTTDILKGVIEDGTGKAADIGRPAAGKTGTTQAYRDAWFAGYTPQLSAAVWVGYPDAAREMTNIHGRKVTGGSFPAEIWAKFMEAAHEGVSEKDFAEPDEGLAHEEVCEETGLIATAFCPETRKGIFLDDAVPKKCDVHNAPRQVEVPNVTGMTRDKAEAALEKAGFVVALKGSSSASGTVTSQDPRAGTKAKQGSTVTIGFGSSPEPETGGTEDVSFSFDGGDGLMVTFTARAPRSDSPRRFRWDFGDGTFGEGEKTSHRYVGKGEYSVSLKVTDASGTIGSAERTIKVKGKP